MKSLGIEMLSMQIVPEKSNYWNIPQTLQISKLWPNKTFC